MATNQAVAESPKDIVIGSAAGFYSTDGGSNFVKVGLGDGWVFAEEITPLDVNPDNGVAPDILRGVASQKATIGGEFLEYDLSKLDAIRGGIDTYSIVASSLVSGAAETTDEGDWSYSIPITISGKNGSGAIPTINSVTGGTDGALVLDTDYTVSNIVSTNDWIIQIIDSATVTTESQDIVVNIDYTPAASETLSTGGLSSMTPIWWRFVNRVPDIADAADALANTALTAGDAIYRRTTYDFYSCTVNAGDSSNFKSKDDTSPQVPYVLSLLAEIDETRTLGDQLKSVKKELEKQSDITL